MARKIIVPLDQSHIAECAVPYARALAQRTGLPITLLSVIEPSGSLPDPPADEDLPPVEEPPSSFERRYSASLPIGVNPGTMELSDEEFEEMSNALSEAEQYLSYVGDSITETQVEKMVVYGDAVGEIVKAVHVDGGDLSSAPLIVMASHGRSGLGRMLLGSVALKVAEQATCPMVIVRALRSHVPAVADIGFNRVVIALDGSNFSESVLDPIRFTFGHDQSSLHLLRVVDVNRSWVTGEPADTDAEGRTLRDDAEQYLSTMADRLIARGYTVTWDVVEGQPGERITSVADDVQADMIALATHGYSGLKRLRIGSVAEEVLNRATRPMFLVRPEETHGATS